MMVMMMVITITVIMMVNKVKVKMMTDYGFVRFFFEFFGFV